MPAEDPDPRTGPREAVRWFLSTEDGTVSFVRELLSSVLAVAMVGLLLFAISGVWPPMVAVESPSMEPNMYAGDLVFVMSEDRFVPAAAHADTGVVTWQAGRDADYWSHGDYGDVIVFTKPNSHGPPIIHRARFWVNDGENWYQRADPDFLPAENCAALSNCPAPHAGFVTKGDGNPYYDQATHISDPVKPEWVRGTAEYRVPWLGCIRLWASGQNPPNCQVA